MTEGSETNEDWQRMTNAVRLARQFRDEIKALLEDYPLYRKLRFDKYEYWDEHTPDVIYMDCATCKAERPYRNDGSPLHLPVPGNSGPPMLGSTPKREPQRYMVKSWVYWCTACRNKRTFWIEINNTKKWMWKVGQVPMWLPPIPKDIESELGEDAELYKKALRNMNESYGIGACAYLRRLLENQINPLLSVLHEIKKEEGATTEELTAIEAAIKERNFTKKTEFASEIAPSYIMIDGFNPFKIIHDNLSDALHNLDEETCMRYATEISDALVFIIRGLKKHHQERKEYAAKLKSIRGLSSK